MRARHPWPMMARLFTALAICSVACTNSTTSAVPRDDAQWQTRASIPYRVQEIYPALHKGEIYLAGGLSPDVDPSAQGISDRLYIYNPATDAWRRGPSLPEPRHHPYLVSTGPRLYAFGGFVAAHGGRWSASADILLLDEAAGQWRKVSQLKHPQSETVAAFIDGRVYLASGRAPEGTANANWNDQRDIRAMQIFDPRTNEVTVGPAAPTARNSAAGAVIDGQLYVVGGRVVNDGNRATTEVYQPATGTWRTVAPMPNAQGGIAAAAVAGKLYVFGGEFFGAGGSGVHDESWAYDPKTDKWSTIPAMSVPRHGLGAVATGQDIFVIAGATRAGGAGTSDRVSVFRPSAAGDEGAISPRSD